MKKILTMIGLTSILLAGHGDSNDAGMKLLQQGKMAEALKTFEKECDNDKNGWACGNAAIMHYRGIATKKNVIKAKEYDKKGCDLNDIDSCENLGEILLVADKNALSAKVYFQKVCEMGKYARNGIEKKTVQKACIRAKEVK
jgi:TPR repeat protein